MATLYPSLHSSPQLGAGVKQEQSSSMNGNGKEIVGSHVWSLDMSMILMVVATNINGDKNTPSG
jgi:hypothetical protein